MDTKLTNPQLRMLCNSIHNTVFPYRAGWKVAKKLKEMGLAIQVGFGGFGITATPEGRKLLKEDDN